MWLIKAKGTDESRKVLGDEAIRPKTTEDSSIGPQVHLACLCSAKRLPERNIISEGGFQTLSLVRGDWSAVETAMTVVGNIASQLRSR